MCNLQLEFCAVWILHVLKVCCYGMCNLQLEFCAVWILHVLKDIVDSLSLPPSLPLLPPSLPPSLSPPPSSLSPPPPSLSLFIYLSFQIPTCRQKNQSVFYVTFSPNSHLSKNAAFCSFQHHLSHLIFPCSLHLDTSCVLQASRIL